jgi:hypothetical protein
MSSVSVMTRTTPVVRALLSCATSEELNVANPQWVGGCVLSMP